ncbi:heterokaryon incompatibility protein-domain-containing protein [Xylaria scruposa]|nr:heterokaryon incompatibility protein-domain-containing protein [Xylaria scruposa]
MAAVATENMPSAGLLNNQHGDRYSELYCPLDITRCETRILLITATNPIKLSFEYASMIDDHLEPFQAISWCWGAAGSTTQITVDGHSLSIPASAYEVILELCVPQKKKRVWIDAICINQDDIDERSQQVATMEAIYRKASMTLVWLGKDDGTTKNAMNMIEKIDRWRHVGHPENPDPVDDLRRAQTGEDAFPVDIEWGAIASLFSAAWFTRFWIIQEVALSKHTHVFRGKYGMCWAYFGKTAHFIVHNTFHEELLNTGMSGLYNAVMIARLSAGTADPLIFLELSSAFEATDPRDRVFAMYGVLPTYYSDGNQTALRKAYLPDYGKTLVDVYTDATRAAIILFPHFRLPLLLQVHSLVQRVGCKYPDTDFPSWVPRYHFVGDQTRGSYRPAISYNKLGASSFTGPAKVDTNTPRNILRIAGVIIDTSSEVCEPLPASVFHCSSRPCPYAHHVRCNPQPCAEHSRVIYERVSELWYTAITLNSQVPLSELATMLRTTLLGRADETGPYLDDDSNRRHRRNFQQFIAKLWPAASNPPMESNIPVNEEVDDIDDSDLDNEYVEDYDFEELEQAIMDPVATNTQDEDDASFRSFWNTVVECNTNRRFFVTESGRMGSAAPGCRKGDKICSLFGLDVPVVLRQENGGWILIGDAYLSGGMKGEHISHLKSIGKLEEETKWFDLR